MKILRAGRQQAEWSQEVTCTGHGNGGTGCHSLLLASKEDLFKTHARAVSGLWFVTIRCPECGQLTDLGMLDHLHRIPAEIRANLPPRLAWEAQQTAKAATPQPEEPPR